MVIITESEATLSEEDVTFLPERLAGYKLPRKVTFCREFPRTPLGKVRKFLLQQNSKED
jgi:fatty-acyl-CoA synthase